MYKDKLFELAKNLSKIGNFSGARDLVKLAVSGSESPEEIYKSYEIRSQKLKERNIESNLTRDDIKVILSLIDDQINYMIGRDNQTGFNARSARCSYCDKPIITRDNVSLDRVDNSQGYILGNLVFACSECNMFKGQYYLNDYIENAINVAKNLKAVGPGRKKILDDAKKLKQTVMDYLREPIEDGYTMATHPTTQEILTQRTRTSNRTSATYKSNIDKILEALSRSINISGPVSIENIFQLTSNILNRENRDVRLDWSYQKIREFILNNFELFKEKAEEVRNEDALFALEIIESELDDREGDSDIAVKRPEAKLLTLIKNEYKVSDILAPLNSGAIDNIDNLVANIRNSLNAPYINGWDVGNFISRKMTRAKTNFYISILKSKRDLVKSKIIELKNNNHPPEYIVINIHKTILANSEDGRAAVRSFIKNDTELNDIISKPLIPQP